MSGLGAHNGLESDIVLCPKSAIAGLMRQGRDSPRWRRYAEPRDLGGDNRCGTRKIEQRCGSVRKMQRLMNPNLIVPVSRPSRLSRIAWTGSVPIRRLRWLA
jgi:hypothetical protein